MRDVGDYNTVLGLLAFSAQQSLMTGVKVVPPPKQHTSCLLTLTHGYIQPSQSRQPTVNPNPLTCGPNPKPKTQNPNPKTLNPRT